MPHGAWQQAFAAGPGGAWRLQGSCGGSAPVQAGKARQDPHDGEGPTDAADDEAGDGGGVGWPAGSGPGSGAGSPDGTCAGASTCRRSPATQTYAEEDVLGAAEDVFGKGAEGLAEIVRKTFKDRGQPNAYIVGREAGGAFIVGVRYGSGMLYHKVEGERKIHWTGPSVGFDIGGDGSKVFALVYNLNDTEDLYRRYPAVEGKAYLIGGFTANYLQRDNIVIVPIKLGVGWRLGLNGGYLKFSKKGKVLPF
jgi:hypothetical protein